MRQPIELNDDLKSKEQLARELSELNSCIVDIVGAYPSRALLFAESTKCH